MVMTWVRDYDKWGLEITACTGSAFGGYMIQDGMHINALL